MNKASHNFFRPGFKTKLRASLDRFILKKTFLYEMVSARATILKFGFQMVRTMNWTCSTIRNPNLFSIRAPTVDSRMDHAKTKPFKNRTKMATIRKRNASGKQNAINHPKSEKVPFVSPFCNLQLWNSLLRVFPVFRASNLDVDAKATQSPTSENDKENYYFFWVTMLIFIRVL